MKNLIYILLILMTSCKSTAYIKTVDYPNQIRIDDIQLTTDTVKYIFYPKYWDESEYIILNLPIRNYYSKDFGLNDTLTIQKTIFRKIKKVKK